MTATSPPWLHMAYKVSLVLHAMIVAAAIWLAITAAASLGSTADAARGGVWLAALIMAMSASPAIPSAFVLLSWRICRRRGWTPTPGHMGLAVAAAVLLIVYGLVVALS